MGTSRLFQLGNQRIEVTIPPGADKGTRVRVSGKGAPGVAGGPAGDLFLVIEISPDDTFTRQGINLDTVLSVDLYTTILGGEVQIPTPDGRHVLLTIPPETQNNKKFRLKGKGMPVLGNPSERGDLFASIQVLLPEDIQTEEMDLFKRLQKMRQ
jgi:curved DNA-binding protein